MYVTQVRGGPRGPQGLSPPPSQPPRAGFEAGASCASPLHDMQWTLTRGVALGKKFLASFRKNAAEVQILNISMFHCTRRKSIVARMCLLSGILLPPHPHPKHTRTHTHTHTHTHTCSDTGRNSCGVPGGACQRCAWFSFIVFLILFSLTHAEHSWPQTSHLIFALATQQRP